jgi:O-antigen/teichoic acid export membrane protein
MSLTTKIILGIIGTLIAIALVPVAQELLKIEEKGKNKFERNISWYLLIIIATLVLVFSSSSDD